MTEDKNADKMGEGFDDEQSEGDSNKNYHSTAIGLSIVVLFIIGVAGVAVTGNAAGWFVTCEDVETSYTVYESCNGQESYQAQECHPVTKRNTVAEDKSETILTFDDVSVEPRGRYGRSVYIPAGRDVEVSFRTDDAIDFWVVTKEEWDELVRNGYNGNFDNPLVKRFGVTSSNVAFHVPMSTDYYAYFKNNYFFQKVAIFDMQMTAKWTENVEKTYTEQECETVTKHRTVAKQCPVTKTKIEKVCK